MFFGVSGTWFAGLGYIQVGNREPSFGRIRIRVASPAIQRSLRVIRRWRDPNDESAASALVDVPLQSDCMYVCNSLIYEKTDTIYLATPN